MKKITKLFFVLCLALGMKNLQAQCTVNFNYSIGPNGVVSFTGTASPWNGTTSFYWYLPGSTTPFGPQGPNAWNATATYTANGTYTVMFGISSSAPVCSVNISQTIAITNFSTTPSPTCNLQINYTSPSPNLCNGSATVIPASNMCGPITYTWLPGAFSGATASGLCQGTSYTVMASGLAGANCCSVAVGVVNIPTVNPCALTANFSWTQASGGVVNFNNTSTNTNGGTTYSWNFGDGGNSTSASPPHTYTANGTYTVTLIVNNNLSPACISTQTYVVYVNTLCNLNAGFTFNNQTSNVINFVNGTTGNFGPVGYTWNFGDGSQTSNATNPQHTYTATGTYWVLLTANNFSVNSGTCVDTAMIAVNITTICVANASFSLSPTGTPQYWNAFPIVPTNVIAAQWYWGDGNTSNTLYTSHTYSTAGVYSICLSVTLSCGATTIYCAGYSIYRSTEDVAMVYVNVINPETVGFKNNNTEGLNYNIYPNPNNGSFNLKGLNNGPIQIAIYNLVGKLVYQAETNSVNGRLPKDIELSGVSNGVYFVRINSDNKVVTTKMIIENNK